MTASPSSLKSGTQEAVRHPAKLTERPPPKLDDAGDLLAELRRLEQSHPFWDNRLFRGFKAGAFSRDDIKYIFSQYQLYSKSFTRFISALMANCENDLYRSRLSENLWEEGGGCEPDKRHAEIFRRFLRESLGVKDPDATDYAPYARHFVREYLVFCLRSEPAAGSAFLSLGTEGIVARMYAVFVEGMKKVGFEDKELQFFHIHMECDDEHAATLEEIMLSYTGQPAWFESCAKAMNHALSLRTQFFENIFEGLQERRLTATLDRMRARTSLLTPEMKTEDLRYRLGDEAAPLYANKIDRLNIEFSVNRLPFKAEVLDPRTVRIPAGKCTENHRHAHETFMYFLEGTATVTVDDKSLEVRAGDSVFVPRWSLHQTKNTGTAEVRFVAVTDFNLTERALFGNPEAYRMSAEVG